MSIIQKIVICNSNSNGVSFNNSNDSITLSSINDNVIIKCETLIYCANFNNILTIYKKNNSNSNGNTNFNVTYIDSINVSGNATFTLMGGGKNSFLSSSNNKEKGGGKEYKKEWEFNLNLFDSILNIELSDNINLKMNNSIVFCTKYYLHLKDSATLDFNYDNNICNNMYVKLKGLSLLNINLTCNTDFKKLTFILNGNSETKIRSNGIFNIDDLSIVTNGSSDFKLYNNNNINELNIDANDISNIKIQSNRINNKHIEKSSCSAVKFI